MESTCAATRAVSSDSCLVLLGREAGSGTGEALYLVEVSLSTGDRQSLGQSGKATWRDPVGQRVLARGPFQRLIWRRGSEWLACFAG